MFTVHDVEQRSDAWRALRLGRLCGSRAADMLATIRSGGEAAGRRNLKVQLVLERLTNRPHERGFISPAMLDGQEREANAAALYEALTGTLLQSVGYVSLDGIMAGCSPDGVIGEFEGLVEVKSPIPATHLDYLETQQIPGEYLKQITHNLWITGAQWCDWLSFQPDFPEPLQVRLVRVDRDDAAIAAYEQKAIAFLAEVDLKVAALRTLADVPGTLTEAVA